MLRTVLPVQCVPLDSPCDSVTAQARAVVCGGLNQLGYRKSLASSRSRLCSLRGRNDTASVILRRASEEDPIRVDGLCPAHITQHAARPEKFVVVNVSTSNETASGSRLLQPRCGLIGFNESSTRNRGRATQPRPRKKTEEETRPNRQTTKQPVQFGLFSPRIKLFQSNKEDGRTKSSTKKLAHGHAREGKAGRSRTRARGASAGFGAMLPKV